MLLRGGDSTFKTTSWTMVKLAPTEPDHLKALLLEYWTPVYAYIRRRGRTEDAAADLTQAFFTAMLEDQKLLESADPDRGRFRSFLVKAVENFLVDERRREIGRRGGKGLVLQIDREMLRRIEPSSEDDPAAAFDRQWATKVLDDALQRVKAACLSDGLDVNWSVFEDRVLRPTSVGAAPTPVVEMMADLGVSSEQEVYSMMQTMRRKLQRELLAVVSETIHDPADAVYELAELMQALARPV